MRVSIYGECEIGFGEVLASFPEERIFAVSDGRFQEYDRQTGAWSRIGYGDIIPEV